MESFGYKAPMSESAASLPDWMYDYVEHEAKNAGASTHDMDFSEIGAEWDKFAHAANAALEEMLGEIGAEDYLDVDGDLYLLFQTIVESGRSFMDGDLDHVNLPLELEALSRGLQDRLNRYVDYTGGGSLNDAIQNTIAGAEGYDRHSDAEANPHDGGMYGEPEGGHDAPVDESEGGEPPSEIDKRYAARGPSGVGPDEIEVNLGDVASVGKKGNELFWRHTNGLKNSYSGDNHEGKFFMSLRDAGLFIEGTPTI